MWGYRQKIDAGPVWSPFSDFFAIQKGLNGLQSCTEGQIITIQYWSILSLDGGSEARYWGPLGAVFTPFFIPKVACITQIRYNGTDYEHTIIVGSLWGGVIILAHFGCPSPWPCPETTPIPRDIVTHICQRVTKLYLVIANTRTLIQSRFFIA